MAKPDRNITAHADAVMARIIWGNRYSMQNGGQLDFYESLTKGEQRTAQHCLDSVIEAIDKYGRAKRIRT